MSKNFYIQGDPSRAKEIKAAFEKLGYNMSWSGGCANPDIINIGVERNGAKYVVAETSEYIKDIIKTHPDYQELELSVKPKFKVGDWIIHNNGSSAIPIQVYNLKKDRYFVTNMLGSKGDIMLTYQDEWHLWTIEDAKEGDVLALSWCDENGKWDKVVIFKSLLIVGVVGYGCTFRNNELAFDIDAPYYSTTWSRTLKPATKEQYDLLFTKIKEAGYEWDFEKKEIHKILKRYDINNFKAGMPVLVRDAIDKEWRYVLYSHNTERYGPMRFNAGATIWNQCIPYNDDTKHLLGTTDIPSEEYINW